MYVGFSRNECRHGIANTDETAQGAMAPTQPSRNKKPSGGSTGARWSLSRAGEGAGGSCREKRLSVCVGAGRRLRGKGLLKLQSETINAFKVHRASNEVGSSQWSTAVTVNRSSVLDFTRQRMRPNFTGGESGFLLWIADVCE